MARLEFTRCGLLAILVACSGASSAPPHPSPSGALPVSSATPDAPPSGLSPESSRAELRAAFQGRPALPPRKETPIDVKFRAIEGSCAVDTEGRLWCWGPLTKSRTPRLIEGISGATAPLALGEEACALVAPKRIRCATGTKFSGPDHTPPFERVLAAHSHCALVEGGKIDCWGPGPDVTVPADVVAFTNAPCTSDVGHVLLHADGRVSTAPCGPDVSSLRDIVQIDGSSQTCGVTRQGRVACTARTDVGSGIKPFLPVGEIAGIEGAVEVAVASQYACARLSSGRVKCFGDLRDPGSEEPAPLFPGVSPKVAAPPTDIGLAGVSDIAIDQQTDSFCAVSKGTITCNGVARIGAYVPIDGLPPMIDVACGDHSCCSIDANDALWCWGDVGLSRPALPARRDIEAIALSSFSSDALALSKSGDLHQLRQGKLVLIGPAAWPNPPAGVRLLAGGPNGSDALCAHVPGGEARCWWREGGALSHSVRLDLDLDRPTVVSGSLRDVTVHPECGIGPEAWCRVDGKRMPASAWDWKEKPPAVITDLQNGFRSMHTELGVIGDGRHYDCHFNAARPSAPPSCRSYVDHRVPDGATAIWTQHQLEGYVARDGSITIFPDTGREAPPPPKRVVRTSLVRRGSGGDAAIDDAGRVWVWPPGGAGRGLVGGWGGIGKWTELRPVR